MTLSFTGFIPQNLSIFQPPSGLPMPLLALGLNHRTAPVAVRERVAPHPALLDGGAFKVRGQLVDNLQVKFVILLKVSVGALDVQLPGDGFRDVQGDVVVVDGFDKLKPGARVLVVQRPAR